jgi:hypothetical protein
MVMTHGYGSIERRRSRQSVGAMLLGAMLAILVSAAAKANDIDFTILVAPKNIRANNTTEKSSFFRSLGLTAFRDALTVLRRPKDGMVNPGDWLFPDGSSVVYGYGYRISNNTITPYGAEFEFENRTGFPLALVGYYACEGDLNCVEPSFPAMRFAVRNNGLRPLTVRQILVKVQKSEPNLVPRFGISFSPGLDDIFNNSGEIFLYNDSKSTVTSARLEFDLACELPDIASHPITQSSHTYKYMLNATAKLTGIAGADTDESNPFKGAEVGSITRASPNDPQVITFVFWQELAKVIPDIANVMRDYYNDRANEAEVTKRISDLYRAGSCKPYVVGRLSGTYAGPGGAAFPFATAILTKVNVSPCCGGADSKFHINAGRANLRSSGANYQLPIAVNRTIPPGQEASVALDLTVDESSNHQMIFQAVTDQGTVDSGPYQARLFVPWSSILYGRRRR